MRFCCCCCWILNYVFSLDSFKEFFLFYVVKFVFFRKLVYYEVKILFAENLNLVCDSIFYGYIEFARLFCLFFLFWWCFFLTDLLFALFFIFLWRRLRLLINRHNEVNLLNFNFLRFLFFISFLNLLLSCQLIQLKLI